MPLIKNFHKTFFRLKTRHKLPRIPKMLANRYDRTKDISFDVDRVFARLGVRSPEMVDKLIQKYHLESVDQLVALLPHYRARPRPLDRLIRLLQDLFGVSRTEPVLRPALRKLKAEGRLLDHQVNPELKERLRRVLEPPHEP